MEPMTYVLVLLVSAVVNLTVVVGAGFAVWWLTKGEK